MGRSGGEGPARERCNGESPAHAAVRSKSCPSSSLVAGRTEATQKSTTGMPARHPTTWRLGCAYQPYRPRRRSALSRAGWPTPVNPRARPMPWSSLRLPESAVAETPWLASLVPVKFAIFIMEVRLIGLQARSIAMTSASRDRKTAGKEKTVMPPASKWVTVLSAVVLSSRGGSNAMRLPRTRSMQSKWWAQKRLTRQRNEVHE